MGPDRVGTEQNDESLNYENWATDCTSNYLNMQQADYFIYCYSMSYTKIKQKHTYIM